MSLIFGHSGYKDGECVTIKAGGACAILGVGEGESHFEAPDNDRSSSFPTGDKNLVMLWIAQSVEMCEYIGLNIGHLILQTPTLKANMIQFDGL